MYGLSSQVSNLKKRVEHYKDILSNTELYRAAWTDGLREEIIKELTENVNAIDLPATTELQGDMENLQAIVLSLGDQQSGMYHKLGGDLKKHMIKHNGSLIYQQLFNGKIIVLINFPSIENYGEPRPPKTVGIYRPEELTPPFFVRHLEVFVTEVTNWEDYDDDEPSNNTRIGFDYSLKKDVSEVEE